MLFDKFLEGFQHFIFEVQSKFLSYFVSKYLPHLEHFLFSELSIVNLVDCHSSQRGQLKQIALQLLLPDLFLNGLFLLFNSTNHHRLWFPELFKCLVNLSL